MVYSLGLLENDKFHIQFTACVFIRRYFRDSSCQNATGKKTVSRKHIKDLSRSFSELSFRTSPATSLRKQFLFSTKQRQRNNYFDLLIKRYVEVGKKVSLIFAADCQFELICFFVFFFFKKYDPYSEFKVLMRFGLPFRDVLERLRASARIGLISDIKKNT